MVRDKTFEHDSLPGLVSAAEIQHFIRYELYVIIYIQKVIEDSYFYALLNLIKTEDKIYNSSDIQDILTPIHTRMGTDNRHTALIIDIRLRIGYDSYF